METKTESDAKWTRLFEIPTIFFNTSEERAIPFCFYVISFISQGIDWAIKNNFSEVKFKRFTSWKLSKFWPNTEECLNLHISHKDLKKLPYLSPFSLSNYCAHFAHWAIDFVRSRRYFKVPLFNHLLKLNQRKCLLHRNWFLTETSKILLTFWCHCSTTIWKWLKKCILGLIRKG